MPVWEGWCKLMNYIWDYLIKSLRKGVEPDKINLYKAEDCSPYMEMSFHDINFSDVDLDTEVNVYYRDTYTAIFKHLFDPELGDGQEIRRQLTDVLLHLLFETDRYQGMSRREYYIRFLIQEMRDGVCGEDVARWIRAFSFPEQIIVSNGILSLYRTGENMVVLRRVLQGVFRDSFLFANTREKNELYFYLRTNETPENQDKIACIINLFMPLRFQYKVYWEEIFGVQNMDVFMVQGEFLQFE